MALLGRAYATKVAQVKDRGGPASSDLSCKRYGKGQVHTDAIDNLLRAVSGATLSKQARDNFCRRLSRASRWYAAAMTLGWGSLCLMPADAIAKGWAEKTLARPERDIWLQLVKKIQPDIDTACRKLDARLGTDGIEGSSLHNKEPLCIEVGPTAVAAAVEELPDSEVETESSVESGDDDDDDDNEDATAGTASPLRQLTLLTGSYLKSRIRRVREIIS
jgi:hypothetical protein